MQKMSIAQSPFRFLQVPFKKVILQSFIPQEIYLLKTTFLSVFVFALYPFSAAKVKPFFLSVQIFSWKSAVYTLIS